MASQKPTFVFFKMLNCGHCTQFAEKPTPETSPWAELLRDKELQAAVNFVRYDWGMEKAASGGVVQHKLPEQYRFVNYGPYFYMHNSQSVDNGLEFKDSGPRTPANMKKWILENLQRDPQLAKARRVASTPLPSPQAVPAQAPRPTVLPQQQQNNNAQVPRIQPPAPQPFQNAQQMPQRQIRQLPQQTKPQVPQKVETPVEQPVQVPMVEKKAHVPGKAIRVQAPVAQPRLNIVSRNRRK